MKENKQACYNNYFETDCNYIKDVWKRITSLISLKTVAFSVPTALSLDIKEKKTGLLYSVVPRYIFLPLNWYGHPNIEPKYF